MKVLFTASVMSHLEAFHIPYMQYFKENGFEVHTAASGIHTLACIDRHYDIDFERSPYKLKNIRCYKTLKKIIDENGYDLIHCHTPVVGMLTRFAARKARKAGTMVIYTAHGFHFYEGAPYLQARIFRMLEKRFSQYTDCLITINGEDYKAAHRYGFKPGACYQVPGVGADASRFTVQTTEKKSESRAAYGIDPEAFVLIFAADYREVKNQQMLLKAVSLLKKRMPRVLLLLPGEGPLRSGYEQAIQALGIEENVRLMGFREDMDRLLQAADVAVSSSVREGLPVNIVEAMAVALPVVATRIRGHVDLIADGVNGFLVGIDDAKAMANRLLLLYENPQIAESMRQKTRILVSPFLLPNVKAEMIRIYGQLIENGVPKASGMAITPIRL
jgi:glycosyltransferase EpsD